VYRRSLVRTKSTEMFHASAMRQTRTHGRVDYAKIRPLSMLAEAGIVSTCAVVSAILYNYAKNGDAASISVYASLGLLAAVVYVGIAHQFKLYDLHEILRGYNIRVLFAWCLTIGVLTLFYFAFKIGSSVSRGSNVGLAALAPVFLFLWRGTAARYFRHAFEKGAIRGRRAILFGNLTELASLEPRELLLNFGVEEIDRVSLSNEASEKEIVNAIGSIVWRARHRSAAEILLAVPWTDSHRLDLIRTELRRLPIPVRLLPDRSVAALLRGDAAWPIDAYAIPLQRAPLATSERVFKRILDLVVACSALLALAPLIAFSAIAIKLESKGPVIFRQRRKGFNEKKFYIYKFRTMKVEEDGPDIAQAKRHDSRVTRVGRVLRESSIDELPQLVNVIKGEMSVVGPRPHAVAHDVAYCRVIANYAQRHHVKPGITGLAQVNGFRGETSQAAHMAKRVELDIQYINSWSIGLDLKILLRTVFEVLGGKNAY
jgi:Undecaprenyl-phosphate glucose phosphotransferase